MYTDAETKSSHPDDRLRVAKPDRADSEFAQMRRAMVEAATVALKDCRVHWIPNTIHDIGYHKPAELAEVIEEFLDGQ